jgi:RNA polymerase sigma-70 factor (ECF subfamily)
MSTPRLSPSVLDELHVTSGAARWDVSAERLATKLEVCVGKRFAQETPGSREVEAYVRSLHLEDLALACACAAGHEGAWEHFIRELRPSLYAAARTMAPGSWQELADSLFAELFGLAEREGQRRSLLDYYHGRARLSTWLRTVLAQRHVDGLRVSARTVAIDDTDGVAEPADPAPPHEPRRNDYVALAQRALDAAVAALDPRDRLRLRLYYGEGLKLAAIGRLLGEHEATVSRKLDRARREIREGIERALRDEHGLRPAAVQECLEQAAGAPELDLSRILTADER